MPSRLPLRALTVALSCAAPLAVQAVPSLITDMLAQMAENSWQKLNVNRVDSVYTPLDQRVNDESPASNFYGFSGSAWDSKRGDLLIWGGDIGNEQGNEAYIFHTATGLWSRGALPSQITSTNGITHTVDGIANAPISGESWDNLVYLKNVDRMAVVGVSREGQTWQDPATGLATGTYFFDPSKADPNKVSGLTGSQVNPAAHPNVVGGQMWQNRANATAMAGTLTDRFVGASTAYANVGGKDVVYVSAVFDSLWRYTVNDLNPANDTWEQIGQRPLTGEDGWGSAAVDTSRNIYLKTLAGHSFGFWDLGNTGAGAENREIKIVPIVDAGTALPDFQYFGVQYDPIQKVFILWDGYNHVWQLTPPDVLDSNGDGILDVGTGWRLKKLTTAGDGPPDLAQPYPVWGKWQYLEDAHAFVGVMDGESGDVWMYKPFANAVPESGTLMMMFGGLLAIGAAVRRSRRQS